LFFASEVIHDLIRSYSPESNGIAEPFNQTINMIDHSMTILAPDFPYRWAEAINMAAYLKNGFQTNTYYYQQYPSNVFTATDQQYHTLSHSEANVM
jgi:hypothetical protein